MTANLGWLVLGLALGGHFGLHLTLYNRLNAIGLPRQLIKAIEWVLLIEMIVTPLLVVWLYSGEFSAAWQGDFDRAALPLALQLYGGLCLATWLVFGIPWLIFRPCFGWNASPATRQVEVVRVDNEVGHPLTLTPQSNWESKLPLNQVLELSLDSIELIVPGWPAALDGYRIAHLSDIHLTGEIHADYTRYAVERATAWQPDLMALTGDIIDTQDGIDWLPEIFAPGEATDGCYFVLGNHDTRVREPVQTRRVMTGAGWIDLGNKTIARTLRGTPTLLIGNEYPWFPRPNIKPAEDDTLRILLSHSPDQIAWARRRGVTLMLAGHTHGGQGRLPWVGPLLSPSWHGSRFASGDFYKPPTTMHVSRGLSGVHLLRVNCRPELSLLTVRCP